MKKTYIDSFKFMTSSLDKLSSNLRKHKITACHYEGKQLDLIKRKGVHPYNYVDSFNRLNVTSLPPMEEFYSKLYAKHNERRLSAYIEHMGKGLTSQTWVNITTYISSLVLHSTWPIMGCLT